MAGCWHEPASGTAQMMLSINFQFTIMCGLLRWPQLRRVEHKVKWSLNPYFIGSLDQHFLKIE
jgi:hypothetical protein